jgi:hypothetical protein
MSEFVNHPELFNRPIRLDKEETSNPLKVISQFFEDYSLSEIRDHNRQMDYVCLSADSEGFQEPGDRDFLLCYRNEEERVLEAAFLLSRNYDPAENGPPAKNSAPVLPHPLIAEIDLTDLQKRIVDIQHKLAQLCLIVTNAYSSGIDKLLKS